MNNDIDDIKNKLTHLRLDIKEINEKSSNAGLYFFNTIEIILLVLIYYK